MKFIATFAVCFFVSSTGFSSSALAWGADAHEAVCEIAYLELNDAARARVDALIAQETDSRIKSFRDSCVWPDFPERLQQSRRPDHFINVPRNWESISNQRCHKTDQCLFTAVHEDIETLTSSFTSEEEKLKALKFLGHWVGDIHQPMHVSYADDRGGNQILVTGVAGCAHNGQTKFHAVWDTCIPKDVMQELGAATVAPDDDDRKAFGRLLHEDISSAQHARWSASLSPLDWANESLAIARRTDVGYCTLHESLCAYAEDSDEYVKDDTAPNEGMRTFSPSGDYENQFGELIKERIQAAGIRLGAVLNLIFGP